MKVSKPTGWRGVMNQGPRPSDFGLSPLADNVDSITQRQRVRVSRISHGIGGGMRVTDEIDLFSGSSTPYPGHWMSKQLSLTHSRTVFGIYAALLCCALLIAHCHLRFEIHDMKAQQHALQNMQRALQREHSMLEKSQMAVISDLGSLKDYAMKNLNMVENGRAPELPVAVALKEKYSEQAIAQARQEKQEEAIAMRATHKRPFRALTDIAFALTYSRE